MLNSLIAHLRKLPTAEVKGGWQSFRKELLHALPALFMPVLVVGTLRFGIATPTEVSVIAVAYAVLVAVFIYRDLTWKSLFSAIIQTGIMTDAVMLIIMASSVIQWILTIEQIPQQLTLWLTSS